MNSRKHLSADDAVVGVDNEAAYVFALLWPVGSPFRSSRSSSSIDMSTCAYIQSRCANKTKAVPTLYQKQQNTKNKKEPLKNSTYSPTLIPCDVIWQNVLKKFSPARLRTLNSILSKTSSELGRCVKVEVVVRGSAAIIVRLVYVDVKQHWTNERRHTTACSSSGCSYMLRKGTVLKFER